MARQRGLATANAGNSMAQAIQRAENHGRYIASILDFNSTDFVTAGEIKVRQRQRRSDMALYLLALPYDRSARPNPVEAARSKDGWGLH